MKIKMLTVAVAALASTGAFAQTSVTMYGVADVGVEYLSHAGGDHSTVRMSSGNLSGSRWGLRGTEDLGGGLKGIFTLESGINIDTGGSADSSRMFNRQAFVGLQKDGFGMVTLGRQQTLLYDFGLNYDPMAIGTRYSIIGQDGAFASRADNAIKYVGTFGAFTVSGLYSFRFNGQEVPGQNNQGAEYSFGLNYATGPLSVGAVYDQQRLGFAGGDSGSKIQRATLAGTYAFGSAKVYGGWRWANETGVAAPNLTGNLAVPGNQLRSNLFWAGLGYQMTPALSLTGAVYYQGVHETSADPWSLVASADYALSKRTDLYLNMAYAINKKDKDRGVVSAVGVSNADQPINGQNQFGAVVGIRHKF